MTWLLCSYMVHVGPQDAGHGQTVLSCFSTHVGFSHVTYLAYLYMLHAGLPETCARQTVPARSTPQVG